MNWEAIIAIVEVVGLLAVVVSLIYVAVQVRQNSQLLERTIQTVRTQTYQYLVEDFNFYRQLFMDREVTELYIRGLSDFRSLTPAERVQFNMVASTYVWTAWYFYEVNRNEGLVEDLNNRLYVDMFKHPGFREWFADYRATVAGGYGEFLSKVMENAGNEDFKSGDGSNLLQGRLE